MKAKRCPVCGGKPKYVHYSIPGATKGPYGLYILFKRLECENCGATVASLVLTCDDAVKYWNSLNKEGKFEKRAFRTVRKSRTVEEGKR